MVSTVVAVMPGVHHDLRTVAVIAAPVLGACAYNCYRANARQKAMAEARARKLQQTYVSSRGSGKPAQRYYAVTVPKDQSVKKKFKVKEGIQTKEVMIIDAEKGQISDPAVYEIDKSKEEITLNNKNIKVDV